MQDTLNSKKHGDTAFRAKDFATAIDCYTQVSHLYHVRLSFPGEVGDISLESMNFITSIQFSVIWETNILSFYNFACFEVYRYRDHGITNCVCEALPFISDERHATRSIRGCNAGPSGVS